MRMQFQLKDGRDLALGISRQRNGYALVDNADNIYQYFSLDSNNNVMLEGSGNVDESEESIIGKLDVLVKQMLEQAYTGIEEDEEDDITEDDPFNPEEVSIETRMVTMETLLRRLEQNTIKLNPDFQRDEVWSDERKSQLIESLLLKIPIPMFYVSADEKGNWTVVDGLQRISTFRDFLLGKRYLCDPIRNREARGYGMRLKGLEFWKEKLEGLRMNDLPTHLYNRVLETEFNFTLINPGTNEEVKRNIFKRLNTGGMPLSAQEIRNALYTGKATSLLNELAGMKGFKKATCNSIKAQRMEDRELILRFVSFLIREPSTYRKTVSNDTWLSDTMIILNALPKLDTREFNKGVRQGTMVVADIEHITEDDIKDRFEKAMDRSRRLFGEHAFRKSTPGMRRSPINKSLFETWGVILSAMDSVSFQRLRSNKDDFMEEYRKMLADPSFVIAISRDSMKHASVKLRFGKLRDLVNKYSNND